jgi:hypothetical protein
MAAALSTGVSGKHRFMEKSRYNILWLNWN